MAKQDDIYENDSNIDFCKDKIMSPAMQYQVMPILPISDVQAQEQPMSEYEVEFAVFCIENVAAKLGLTGEETYQLLAKDSDIFDEYIIPNYEMLHTQSREYIVNDFIDYMKECRVLT